MEEPQIIIEGLTRIELLSLEEEFKKENIAVEKIPVEDTGQDGKQHMFLTTTLIALNVSKLALDIFMLWWRNRGRKTQSKTPNIKLKLPDGALISFEEANVIVVTIPGNDTPVRIVTGGATEDQTSENIKSFSDVIGDIKDFIKDLADG